MVPALNFNDLIEKYKPDVVKMDVEGFEYFILDKPIDPCVRVLAAEIHCMNIESMNRASRLLPALLKNWKITYELVEGFFGNLQLINLVLERVVDDYSQETIEMLKEVSNPVIDRKRRVLKNPSFGQYTFEYKENDSE